MKVFSVNQIRAWDAFTITHEPIHSIDLMERASVAFVKWFCAHFDDQQPVNIICGMGNNGGDGLAIARILIQKCYPVKVYIVKPTEKGTPDFAQNLQRLHPQTYIQWIEQEAEIPIFPPTLLSLMRCWVRACPDPPRGHRHSHSASQ